MDAGLLLLEGEIGHPHEERHGHDDENPECDALG
jgi:hypothetical protein